MKNYILIATMALVSIFAFSSCSNDVDEPVVNREGEVTTSISVGLPQALQTYAVTSAEGGLANLTDKNLKIRYIMEVYPKNSTVMAKRMIGYKNLDGSDDSKTFTFSNIRLVAAEYNFVFWADIVRYSTQVDVAAGADLNNLIPVADGVYGNRYLVTPSVAEGSILEDDAAIIAYNTDVSDHYELTNLQNIQVANRCDGHFKPVNGEMNDAYRNVTTINLCNDAPIGKITLTRPFAKLRVITTDANVLKGQGIDWKEVDVRPTFSTEIPSTFNVLTNEATGSIPSSSFVALQATLDEYTSENESETNKTVGVWYYLEPTETPNATLNVSVPDLTPFGGIDISVSTVPLVENKLTTIKGKLFSKQTDITIEIDDQFVGGTEIVLDKEASTPEELMASLTGESEQIKYTGRVTKAQGLTLDFTNLTRSNPVYQVGNTSVLALNIPNIEDDATITIIGSENVPGTIAINNGSKCSIRVNAEHTQLLLGGTSYGMLVYNCGLEYNETKPSIDVFFPVDNGKASVFGPANSKTYHRILLNLDYTLPEEAVCKAAKLHTDKTCDYIDTVLAPWLESNSGKTVWDFVKEYQPVTPAE